MSAQRNSEVMIWRLSGAALHAGLFIGGIWEMSKLIIVELSAQVFIVNKIS
jgi:hypothetical protein